MKTRSESNFTFHRHWFRIENIVLVQVWHTTTTPAFYIFSEIGQVEHVLDKASETVSWKVQGKYHSSNPTQQQLERLQHHRDKWDRIIDRLRPSRGPSDLPEGDARHEAGKARWGDLMSSTR
jgi:hypothetical protein